MFPSWWFEILAWWGGDATRVHDQRKRERRMYVEHALISSFSVISGSGLSRTNLLTQTRRAGCVPLSPALLTDVFENKPGKLRKEVSTRDGTLWSSNSSIQRSIFKSSIQYREYFWSGRVEKSYHIRRVHSTHVFRGEALFGDVCDDGQEHIAVCLHTYCWLEIIAARHNNP